MYFDDLLMKNEKFQQSLLKLADVKLTINFHWSNTQYMISLLIHVGP